MKGENCTYAHGPAELCIAGGSDSLPAGGCGSFCGVGPLVWIQCCCCFFSPRSVAQKSKTRAGLVGWMVGWMSWLVGLPHPRHRQPHLAQAVVASCWGLVSVRRVLGWFGVDLGDFGGWGNTMLGMSPTLETSTAPFSVGFRRTAELSSVTRGSLFKEEWFTPNDQVPC